MTFKISPGVYIRTLDWNHNTVFIGDAISVPTDDGNFYLTDELGNNLLTENGNFIITEDGEGVEEENPYVPPITGLDPRDTYLFASMDQPVGETVIVDESPFAHTPSNVQNCVISDTQTIYNHNSLFCPSGSSLQFNMNLGELGDFTIEFDLFLTTGTSNGYEQGVFHYGSSTDGVGGFALGYFKQSSFQRFYVRCAYSNLSATPNIINNTAYGRWVHIAICYYSATNSMRAFADGKRSGAITGLDNMNTVKQVRIGDGNMSWEQNKDKYISEVVITRGIAKFEEDYTPEGISII